MTCPSDRQAPDQPPDQQQQRQQCYKLSGSLWVHRWQKALEGMQPTCANATIDHDAVPFARLVHFTSVVLAQRRKVLLLLLLLS